MNDTNNEKRLNILFIDNFDSFTFNLVDEFEKNDCNVIVYRNNVKIDTIKKIVNDEKIDLIVISPGGYVP
ncbi:anthranilate synthase component II, partial [archaeon]|nr:anthranilate synthase component II [archaeon]